MIVKENTAVYIIIGVGVVVFFLWDCKRCGSIGNLSLSSSTQPCPLGNVSPIKADIYLIIIR